MVVGDYMWAVSHNYVHTGPLIVGVLEVHENSADIHSPAVVVKHTRNLQKLDIAYSHYAALYILEVAHTMM